MGVVTYTGPPARVTLSTGQSVDVQSGISYTFPDVDCTSLLAEYPTRFAAGDSHTATLLPVTYADDVPLGSFAKAVYLSTVTYMRGQVVNSGGILFVCLADGTVGLDPATNPSNWIQQLSSSVEIASPSSGPGQLVTPTIRLDTYYDAAIYANKSAAINAAVAAVQALGATLECRAARVYSLDAAALSIAASAALKIKGNGATLQANWGKPRCIDFTRTADYQTFLNVEITDLTVDANGITSSTNQSIIGNLIDGAWGQRVNFSNITFRRIKAINVPTGTGVQSNYQAMSFVSKHLGSGEATQTSLKHMLFEDCDLTGGGNAGVVVMGSGATPVNVFYDDIRCVRVRHDTLNTPTAFHGDANIQIGGTGFGGTVTLDDCYGAGSGDVGVEIDDPLTAVINRSQFVDAWNCGIFPNNFGGQTDVDGQMWTIKNCITRKVNLGSGNTTSNGIRIGGNFSTDGRIGTVVIENHQHENLSQSLVPGDAVCMSKSHPTGGYKRVIIDGLQMSIVGWNQVVNTLQRVSLVQLAAPAGTVLIDDLHGLDAFVNITRAGGSTASLFLYALGFVGSGTFAHSVRGITGSITQANAVNTSIQFVGFGLDNDSATHRGSIERIGPFTVSGDTSPIGIRFSSGNTYSILEAQNCNLDGAAAGSELSFQTAGDQSKVRVRNIRRRNGTLLAPSGLTGLVSGTGKGLGITSAALAVFATGSGSGITAIDVSTDGGTTYTNFLTQAAGTIPAGANLVLGPLSSDALIKVTFTTTQPTITLVPFES